MAWYKRAEERLVKFLMEDWQRRGSHFLHIGLHAPVIPEFFWDSGFEVTVCEENHHAIEESLLRSGPRISYQLGKFDDLPFENDSFDYAFFSLYATDAYRQKFGLPSALQGKMFTETILAELCRVAKQGVVFVAKNRFSLNKSKYQGKLCNPYGLWRESKACCPKGRVRFASTGFVPRFAPNQLEFLNSSVSYLPFGALIGYGLTFNAPPVSGIGDFIKKEQRKLGQVSCMQRNASFEHVEK